MGAFPSPANGSCFRSLRVENASAESHPCCNASKQPWIWKQHKRGKLQVKARREQAAIRRRVGFQRPDPALTSKIHSLPGERQRHNASNPAWEKMVLLYHLIGSQEVKLAPGHTTSYDQVLLSYSRGMTAGKAMAGRELEVI